MLEDLFPEADDVSVSFERYRLPPFHCRVRLPIGSNWLVGTGTTFAEATADARSKMPKPDAA